MEAIVVRGDPLVIIRQSDLKRIVDTAKFYKMQSIDLSQQILELLRDEFNRQGAA